MNRMNPKGVPLLNRRRWAVTESGKTAETRVEGAGRLTIILCRVMIEAPGQMDEIGHDS